MPLPSLYAIGIFSFSLLVLLVSYSLPESLTTIYYPQIDIKNASEADVLILGGSHAGLSAALTLVRHQIDVLIFDSDSPRNKWKTPIHTVPTWEHHNPDDLRKASRKELRKSGFVRFVHTQITNVQKPSMNDRFFAVSNELGETWRGKKLLVATGVEFVFPAIKGYEENFPDRILHCLFTRGLEFKGSRSAGLLAMGFAETPYHAAMLVEDAQKFAKTVTVYTNGNTELKENLQKLLTERETGNVTIENRKVVQLIREPETSGIMVVLEDKTIETQSFLVHQPDTQPNPELVSQLELETNDRRDIVTKMPFYQTNASGVFAAGDCASPFKIIANGIFQGSNAGAGIARELPRRITGHEVDRLKEQTWGAKLKIYAGVLLKRWDL